MQRTYEDINCKQYTLYNKRYKEIRKSIEPLITMENNYYATIVHELAHTWDFYYGSVIGNDITEQSDIVNLFNKYRNMHNRPFRDYSYTDIKEFFADMVRYYYLKYIDPINSYKNLDYPLEVKKVLEKYICISSNDYDKNMCNG